MSRYTTELRHLIESGFDLGLSEYPIFDERYRSVLNKKIIDRYLFREIGLETAGRFRHFLKMRMNEIMVYYNQLYKSELIEIEPLTRLDYSEDYDWDKLQDTTRNATNLENVLDNGTQTGVSDSSATGTDTNNSVSEGSFVNSDTPVSKMTWDDIDSGVYASETGVNKGTDTNTHISNDTTNANSETVSSNTQNRDLTQEDLFNLKDTESYLKRIHGNNAMRTDSEMLIGFRETFMNIDMSILDELEDLFMQIF